MSTLAVLLNGTVAASSAAIDLSSSFKNKTVGGWGDIGTFSFYPGKNLGAYGEAGAVVTNDGELYDKMLKFRQHGSIEKYVHEIEGHNYRMEEIQAGVLNVKLKYINKWTENRRHIASIYNQELSSIDQEELIPPYCPEYIKHVYHLYVIRIKDRNRFSKYL